jgi:hypothetical protein
MTNVSHQWERVESPEALFDDKSSPQWSDVLPVPALSVQEKGLIKRIAELSKLPNGWDSYGSPPISTLATTVAFSVVVGLGPDFLSYVNVVPVSGGGIQFEWDVLNRGLEVEISPTGAVEYLKSERNLSVEEGPIEDGSFSELRSLIMWTVSAPPAEEAA